MIITIQVDNLPEKWFKEMWDAAIKSAPHKINPKPTNDIKIDYSLLSHGTKNNVLEMLTTGVTVAAIINYQQNGN